MRTKFAFIRLFKCMPIGANMPYSGLLLDFYPRKSEIRTNISSGADRHILFLA
jgi:hypothetical protein